MCRLVKYPGEISVIRMGSLAVRALAAVVSDENNTRGVSVPAVDNEARQSCRSWSLCAI